MAMEFSQGMSMRMDQRQILTPRMIQSMEILQMPVMALEERIDQEMQANPVLEMKAGSDEPRAPAEMDYSKGENGTLTIDPNSADAKEFARLEKLADYLSNEEWSTNDSPRYRGRATGDDDRDGKMDALANSAARTGSLAEHLLDQWKLMDLDPDVERAGRWVIMQLGPDGYLRTELAALLAESPHQHIPLAHAQQALRLIQTLDPAGIGARNLSECMRLQLDSIEEDEELAEGHDFPLERALVNHHLEDLAQNRYPQLSKRLGVSIDTIKAAVRRLGRLNPAPGKQFAPNDAPPITPDATIFFDEDTQRYEIKMRNDPSDNLYIRKKYRAMLQDKSMDKKTREFLGDKVRSARWLMDAINQRKSTIARVIRVVVDAQQEFFEKGPEFLKPLPMINVADQLGIHVATVSRAVSEKWIETPVGVFPLRRFFSMGTTDASGTEMSWDAVKEKIRKIVEDEDKQNPLNDDEIVEKVQAQGIELARRTVAKYRKILNIPTARQRKEF